MMDYLICQRIVPMYVFKLSKNLIYSRSTKKWYPEESPTSKVWEFNYKNFKPSLNSVRKLPTPSRWYFYLVQKVISPVTLFSQQEDIREAVSRFIYDTWITHKRTNFNNVTMNMEISISRNYKARSIDPMKNSKITVYRDNLMRGYRDLNPISRTSGRRITIVVSIRIYATFVSRDTPVRRCDLNSMELRDTVVAHACSVCILIYHYSLLLKLLGVACMWSFSKNFHELVKFVSTK